MRGRDINVDYQMMDERGEAWMGHSWLSESVEGGIAKMFMK